MLAFSHSLFDVAALTLGLIDSENNIFYVQNRFAQLTPALPLLWSEHHLLNSYTIHPSAAILKIMDGRGSVNGEAF